MFLSYVGNLGCLQFTWQTNVAMSLVLLFNVYDVTTASYVLGTPVSDTILSASTTTYYCQGGVVNTVYNQGGTTFGVTISNFPMINGDSYTFVIGMNVMNSADMVYNPNSPLAPDGISTMTQVDLTATSISCALC
jgi:hypothetical protein